MVMRVFTHVCCGPCFTAVHEELSADFELAVFYFNPNIHPAMEYRRRLMYLRRFCDDRQVPLSAAEYRPETFFEAVRTEIEQPERCRRCYQLRLEATARQAAIEGYDVFTTTLLISPYQFHDVIAETGGRLAREYNVDFMYRDWRPLFKRSVELARTLDMYRQKYCGCLYSESERYRKKLSREISGPAK
jgi:predicted adenine nucleotide alpha hydrolase (AANH) superfamily ATPase